MMPAPGSPDASHQIRGQYVASTRDRLLGKLLEQARSGMLNPDWRSQGQLHPPPASDDDRAAVIEIQQMPRQPWEPEQSPWRVALDAWFIAQFGINERARVHSTQVRVSVLEGQARAALSQVTVALLAGAYTDGMILEELTSLPYPELHDPNSAVHRARRDELIASYLAGLHDGGISNDWAGWLRARSHTWGDPMAANKWKIMLNGPTVTHMWRLPSYWRGRD